jgi:S1-C subfamily serine protease
MRKFVKYLIIIFVALPIVTYGATYTLASANYPINVNGFKLSVQPLNLNGTTYLPLRSISEAVGVPIEWNNATKSVEIDTVDVDRLKEACVMIYADDGKTQVQGSGVYTDYFEVTSAYHVVDKRPNVKESDGDILTIDEYDSVIDIATLESTDEVKPVKIGDSDDVKVGDRVIVIGSPDGKEDAVTYTTVKRLTSDIVITKTLNGGGSGSAVFDIRGNLIAIIVESSVSSNESYAIPINTIRETL